MPTVRVSVGTTVAAEVVLEAARDFTDRRAELFRDVHLAHLKIHEIGDGYADVTEGNPWPIGYVWERLHYDWSQPGSVKGTVIDSNIFKPGSTWEIRATPTDKGSTVEIIGVRRLRGFKGWLLAPLFPLSLAKSDVADYLRQFVAVLEDEP